MKNQTSSTTEKTSSKTDVSGDLDRRVNAVCECGEQMKQVTFRNLKNRWPHCRCNQPMKVKADADATI